MNAVETIARAVADIRGVTFTGIISDRRTRDLIGPRHEAFYFAKILTPASLPAIGRRLGGKDHTSVLHGVRRIKKRIATVVGYGDELEVIGSRIVRLLPDAQGFQLVPPEDIDVGELAQRIDAAMKAGETASMFADEVCALARRVIDLEKQLGIVRDAISRFRPVEIMVTETPDLLPEATALVAQSSDQIATAAKAAVDAWTSLQSQKFSARERFAVQAFERAFTNLKTIIETERAAA